jgi:hypothetical protein
MQRIVYEELIITASLTHECGWVFTTDKWYTSMTLITLLF